MKKVIFEAGQGNHFDGGVNYLISEDRKLYAECKILDGVSDDYGYMTMKKALIEAYKSAGGDPDELEFWYDGQEQYLAEDASADCEVYTDVEVDEKTVDKQIHIVVEYEVPYGDEFFGLMTYDRNEAVFNAEQSWAHMSSYDKKRQRVRVDVYNVKVPEGDKRTPKEVYDEMTEDDVWCEDPADVIEITDKKVMDKDEFVRSVMENDRDGIEEMTVEQAADILDWMRGDDEDGVIPDDLTPEEFATIWNDIKGI